MLKAELFLVNRALLLTLASRVPRRIVVGR
jgi:hypothetical protein